MLKYLLFIFLFGSITNTYSQSDTFKKEIGFGCGASGTDTYPVAKMTRLLAKKKYAKIRKLLFKKRPVNQFLAVFVLERLVQKKKLLLSEKEIRRIEQIKKSVHIVRVCYGCIYQDKMTLRLLFERIKEHKFYLGAEGWFNYNYELFYKKE